MNSKFLSIVVRMQQEIMGGPKLKQRNRIISANVRLNQLMYHIKRSCVCVVGPNYSEPSQIGLIVSNLTHSEALTY